MLSELSAASTWASFTLSYGLILLIVSLMSSLFTEKVSIIESLFNLVLSWGRSDRCYYSETFVFGTFRLTRLNPFSSDGETIYSAAFFVVEGATLLFEDFYYFVVSWDIFSDFILGSSCGCLGAAEKIESLMLFDASFLCKIGLVLLDSTYFKGIDLSIDFSIC